VQTDLGKILLGASSVGALLGVVNAYPFVSLTTVISNNYPMIPLGFQNVMPHHFGSDGTLYDGATLSTVSGYSYDGQFDADAQATANVDGYCGFRVGIYSSTSSSNYLSLVAKSDASSTVSNSHFQGRSQCFPDGVDGGCIIDASQGGTDCFGADATAQPLIS
jgi:hypothetical protein